MSSPTICTKNGILLALALAVAVPAALDAQAGDSSRWEATVQAFEAEDAVNAPPEDAIVITGSSSIARWHPNIREDLDGLTIIPRGFGGSTMADLLQYVDRLVIAYEPRAVVIYEGDNDTSRGTPVDEIVGQFQEIVSRIHSELPETRIHVLSVKPSVSRWEIWSTAQEVNERFQEIAAGNDLVTYVDVATPLLQPNGEVMTDIFVGDNLHLNEEGEDIWAATIRDALMVRESQFEPAMR